MLPRFYYVHDPMCSWCWGFRPTWLKLREQLKGQVDLIYLTGGLAPDSDVAMPEELRVSLQGTWHKIHDMLGTEFNFDFWSKNTPRRSTYPACRAVIAASWQDRMEDMIAAIQEGYYLQARNPSDQQILIEMADEIGLDTTRFTVDLNSDELAQEFASQIGLARALPINGFPSIVLCWDGRTVPLPLDYKNASKTLQEVEANLVQWGYH